MRTKVRHIIKIILIFSLIMCWTLSLGYMSKIKGNNKTVTFYFEDNSINGSIVDSLKESKPNVDILAWTEQSGQTIKNDDIGRRIGSLKILFLRGKSSLILKNSVIFQDDIDGCLVDEDTAYKLFGSLNVIGHKIKYYDRELTIRAIHSDSKANVIIQMSKDAPMVLNGLTIDATGLTSTEIKEYKTSAGFKEDGIEGNIYYSVAFIISLAFPVLAMVLYMIRLISAAVKVRKKPVFTLLYVLIGIFSFIVFFKVTGIKINIPLDLIPNKWSDFEFWTKLGKEYGDKYQYLFYMKKYGVDIYNIQSLLMSVFYSGLTVALFVINLNVIKIKSDRELFTNTLIMVISTFLAILIVYTKRGLDVNVTMVWYLYPLYYIGMRFIKYIESFNVKVNTTKNSSAEIAL